MLRCVLDNYFIMRERGYIPGHGASDVREHMIAAQHAAEVDSPLHTVKADVISLYKAANPEEQEGIVGDNAVGIGPSKDVTVLVGGVRIGISSGLTGVELRFSDKSDLEGIIK
jgi:hypothetical protein